MATIDAHHRSQGVNRTVSRHKPRPATLRTQSEIVPSDETEQSPRSPTLARHKSTSTPTKLARLSAGSSQHSALPPFSPTYSSGGDSPLSPKRSLELARERSASLYSNKDEGIDGIRPGFAQDVVSFDFTRIDYELERARKLGAGIWSNVMLAEPAMPRSKAPSSGRLTPPYSPRLLLSGPAAVFAIKLPIRKDATAVLKHEAKVLSHLQWFSGASQYIVTFYGMDPRNDALVSEAVLGGSMEDLTNRLRHMTDFARHQEIVSIWPSLSLDLVTGLEFMHNAGIVHADIKPQNVLLDISDHYSLPAPVIRARYIDFSASFMPAMEDSMPAGGGTWDYMAPEQMRIQKDLNRPTFASDIWSLGISLLYVIVLGSPYSTACNGNVFLLREAIKSADPLGFAKTDPKAKERMDACQGFIDACRLALQKDRDRRVTAASWRKWLVEQDA